MSEDTDRQARLTQVAAIAVALEKQTQMSRADDDRPVGSRIPGGARSPSGMQITSGSRRTAATRSRAPSPTIEVIDGKPVEEELQFADYDSLEDSCRDYAALITTGEPYSAAWEQYSVDRNLNALIVAVAANMRAILAMERSCRSSPTRTNVQRAIVGRAAGGSGCLSPATCLRVVPACAPVLGRLKVALTCATVGRRDRAGRTTTLLLHEGKHRPPVRYRWPFLASYGLPGTACLAQGGRHAHESERADLRSHACGTLLDRTEREVAALRHRRDGRGRTKSASTADRARGRHAGARRYRAQHRRGAAERSQAG